MRLQSALVWTLVSVATRYALKLLGNLALARMLSPDDFGLAAIVMSVVTGIEALTDVGTKPALIRSHRTDDDWLDTAWTLGAVRGAGISILIAICAFPIARFFEDDRLGPLIAVTASMSLLVGLTSISAVTLVRNLDVKRLTILETLSAIMSYVVMLTWAAIMPSAWALISGALASTGAFTIASWYWLSRRRVTFKWQPEIVRELMSFGKWVFFSSLAGFIIIQGDRFAVGKFVGIAAVGVYSIGQTWSYALRSLIAMGLSRIYLPVVAELYRKGSVLPSQISNMRRILIAALIVPFVFGASFSEPLIEFLYPREFAGAGIIMQVLVIGGWFSTLESLYKDQLIAKGEPAWHPAVQILSILIMGLSLITIKAEEASAVSFAIIFSLGAGIRGFGLLIITERKGIRQTIPDLSLTLIYLGLVSIITFILDGALAGTSAFMVLIGGFVALLPFGLVISILAAKKILANWNDIEADVRGSANASE